MPRTWAGKSVFEYSGSVETGTLITYGKGFRITVTADQYRQLRQHFLGNTVPAGTSKVDPPAHSIGRWLIDNVTKTATASYVCEILVLEKYAEKHGSEIKIFR